MSAPRFTLHTHPAQRRDDARLTRAAAWRELSEPVRRGMRQRIATPSTVISATIPTRPHGSDVPFQMVLLAHESGSPLAAAIAYWTRGKAWTLALYRAALRSCRTLLTETERADAQYRAWLVDAMADGVLTPSESRAGAACLLYRITVSEELAAVLLADAQSDGGRDPRPAA